MRTNIEIDDQLMKHASRSARTPTKRATVEAALRLMIRLRKQEGMKQLRSKIKWEGHLEALRKRRID